MRLATSLGFFAEKTDGGYTSSEESARRCRAAGFKVLDARFTTSMRGKTELVKNNWVELINNLRNEAEKLGVEFSQSHLVYVKGAFL
jgi:L-ribulose-5-phosphate 3-epimerase